MVPERGVGKCNPPPPHFDSFNWHKALAETFLKFRARID